jgi:hypothetical protein
VLAPSVQVILIEFRSAPFARSRIEECIHNKSLELIVQFLRVIAEMANNHTQQLAEASRIGDANRMS